MFVTLLLELQQLTSDMFFIKIKRGNPDSPAQLKQDRKKQVHKLKCANLQKYSTHTC